MTDEKKVEVEDPKLDRDEPGVAITFRDSQTMDAGLGKASEDPSQASSLFGDASAVAAVARLVQMRGDYVEKPIDLAGHCFTPNRMHWSTIVSQAFAMISPLRKFSYWLFGARMNVVLDHDPLTCPTASTPHRAKLARGALVRQH